MIPLAPEEKKPTKTQVRAVQCPTVPPLLVPHYEDPRSGFSSSHSAYHSLGHCLRADIFPGASTPWRSQMEDSYTCHPPPPLPVEPHCWFGRRTDEMVQWTERNILNQRLNKMLKEIETKATLT